MPSSERSAQAAAGSDKVDSDKARSDRADCIGDADCRARRNNILLGAGLRGGAVDDVLRHDVRQRSL